MKSHQFFLLTTINIEQGKGCRPKSLRITAKGKIPVCVLAPVFIFLLFTGLFMASSALADNITYNNDPSLLQTDLVDNTQSSLYPIAGSSLTGNIITVDSGIIPGSVYGGVSVTGGAVTGNKVIFNGGTVDYNVYGGYSGIIIITPDNDQSGVSGVPDVSARTYADANYT